MSSGPAMALPLARARARKLLDELLRHVERGEIVGSIRRQRPKVSDLELLLEPRMTSDRDLFRARTADIEPVARHLAKRGTVTKSGDRYIQVRLGIRSPLDETDDRTKADVFLCHPPAEWGVLRALRTGPADLSKLCVTRLGLKGWRCWRGAVWRLSSGAMPAPGDDPGRDPIAGGWERVPCPTEAAFFEACGIAPVRPEERDLLMQHVRNLQRRETP